MNTLLLRFRLRAGVLLRLFLAAGLVLGGGCASRDPSPASPAAKTKPVFSKPETLSQADVEGDRQANAHAHYATAVLYELDQKPDKALEEYTRCIRCDPGNESLVLDVTRRFLVQRQPDQALELLNLASAQPKASALIFAWQGLAHAQAGRPERAVAAHRLALKKNPQLLLCYQNIAQIQFQTNQLKEVLKTLQDAARLTSDDPAFLADLAELLSAYRPLLGKSGEVLKPRIQSCLAAAAAKKPQNPLILLKLAECYKAVGESAKAAALYKELTARHPNLPGLKEKLAEAYLIANDVTNALEQLEVVVRENPVDVRAHYVLGNLMLESRQYEDALEHFSTVRLLNSGFEPVLYDIARANLALEKPKEALAALDQVKNKTRNFNWEFFTGVARMSLKDYPKAVEHLNNAEVIAQVTETNRLTAFLYFQLGAAYERNQRLEEAEKYFVKCLRLDPDNAEALNYLGYMWAEKGQKLSQAREWIEQALKLEPDNAAILDSMGWVLYQLGQPEAALPHLLKAIDKTKEPDATLFDHLGDTYRKLNEREKAREAWEKSLQVEANEAVKKKLQAP